ncbi:MAG TPA: hypothetical protein DCO79_15515 [Spirochaeta sp.]|nr:hypothetical protein [Spirochaeta sp.]
MHYNGVVQRKIAMLDDQLLQIEKHISSLSYEEFKDNWLLKSGAERALQVAVEIMIDIAERIIALNNAGPAESAAKAMEKLESLEIIKSAEPYRSMVKFRNIIVHEYEEIDPQIMWDLLQNRLDDFRAFRDELDQVK